MEISVENWASIKPWQKKDILPNTLGLWCWASLKIVTCGQNFHHQSHHMFRINYSLHDFLFSSEQFFLKGYFFWFPSSSSLFRKEKKRSIWSSPFPTFKKMLEGQNKPFRHQNCFNIVSASYQCVSLGKGSVLLPVTTRPKWKKCCQGPKSGWPKPLGPHSGNLRGEWKVINDMLWEAVMIGLKLRQRAWLCTRQTTAGESEVGVEWEPDSPPRCVRRIQPGTSGDQTPFHSCWFLYKQVSLSLFGTGATREKFELPKTIKTDKRGVKAAEP